MNEFENPYEQMEPDTSRMLRIGPSDLPGVVARASASGRMGDEDEMQFGASRGQGTGTDRLGAGAGVPGIIGRDRDRDRLTQRGAQPSQQSRT